MERPYNSRKIMYKCPGCGKEHSATKWFRKTFDYYAPQRHIFVSQGYKFTCPNCCNIFKGTNIIPVLYVKGVKVSEGWFALNHFDNLEVVV